MRRLCRGVNEQIDVKIQVTEVPDGSLLLSCVAQYGVLPYLVANLPWDMVLGPRWGYEHCVSHFALFNCLYSQHPVHPRFWTEDFGAAPRTGKPFLVQPIHGRVSRQCVRGITVPIIGAATPMQPAPAIQVTPPDGKPPNRVEAENHVSYALTASSVAPVRDRACSLKLVEFAPEALPSDVPPTRRDGSMSKQSDYDLTAIRATTPIPVQPPTFVASEWLPPTYTHMPTTSKPPQQAPAIQTSGIPSITEVQQAERKQMSWCCDEETSFDHACAIYPPEDKRNSKIIQSGIEDRWAFRDVWPPEDLLKLINEQRSETEDPGNIWSTEGHQFYEPETLKEVPKWAKFPVYVDGTPWYDDEWTVLEFDDNYGQHQTEQALLENDITAQRAGEQAKWLKLRRGRKSTFFEWLQRISRDGHCNTDAQEARGEWMAVQFPDEFTPKKLAEFFALWCAAGQRVTGGVPKFRAHQQFMHLIGAHARSGHTRGFDKVLARFNTPHA